MRISPRDSSVGHVPIPENVTWPHLQDQWIGYVLVCCFGVVFTAITMSMLW